MLHRDLYSCLDVWRFNMSWTIQEVALSKQILTYYSHTLKQTSLGVNVARYAWKMYNLCTLVI